MVRRVAAIAAVALAAAAIAAGCGDLFHSTDWNPACTAAGCSSASGGSGAGAGGTGSGPGAGGAGGGDTGPCEPGDVEACFDGPSDEADVGSCQSGEHTCGEDATWGPCDGQVLPADDETCDDADDADCDGAPSNGCVFASCSALPPGSASGTYLIDPDGAGQGSALTLYCDVADDGTGWALLANSVGSASTLSFWQFAYANRLDVKGTPDPAKNYYAGKLYTIGLEYRDQLEDLSGGIADAAQVTVAGFDPAAFSFASPTLVAGNTDVYSAQFAGGWSASDFDGDIYLVANCAVAYVNVAQHYSACWVLNFGADADEPFDDASWGPHAQDAVLTSIGLTGDGTPYSRVNRYSRWVRW